VLFATHDGETTLPTTLESFRRLAAAPGSWKVVAIDNGSTDRTLEILDSYRERLPLTVIHTPEPGKNRALNLAMVHLQGDFVLFCDDDVVVDPGWLDAYRKAADAHPNLDIFCGPIDPLWPYEPPDWIRRNVPVGLIYALTDCEIPEGECSVDWAWGPNFGLRRGLLEANLPLPENIGPKGKDYPMGSESAFLVPLAEAGHLTGFVPAARVLHIIRPFQMEREWPLGRAYRFGRGSCRMVLNKRQRRFREVFGWPLWLLRDFLLVKAVAALSFGEDRHYRLEGKLRYLQGYLYEYRQIVSELARG
jgi:glycosyltransferase involved in cell wall biosynthesis